MHEIILCKLGEVVLKGLNRHSFETKLMSNIRRRTQKFGKFKIYSRQSTIYVEPMSDSCDLTGAYAGRIVNIHPALLPKFGGKGMYGEHVHQAVIAAGETESGITIHLVNEQYDSGDTLFQATVPVTPDDTPDTLAAKIHVLEHRHFPTVIEQTIQKLR